MQKLDVLNTFKLQVAKVFGGKLLIYLLLKPLWELLKTKLQQFGTTSSKIFYFQIFFQLKLTLIPGKLLKIK